jgi:hypothetical protein
MLIHVKVAVDDQRQAKGVAIVSMKADSVYVIPGLREASDPDRQAKTGAERPGSNPPVR